MCEGGLCKEEDIKRIAAAANVACYDPMQPAPVRAKPARPPPPLLLQPSYLVRVLADPQRALDHVQ